MSQATVEAASDAKLGRIATMVRDERKRAERRLAPFAYREWLDELLALAEPQFSGSVNGVTGGARSR